MRPFLHQTWTQLEALREDTGTAVVPVAQVVQHGPHLPIGTDVFQVEAISSLAVERLAGEGYPVVLGPTIAFGHSPTHESFPGHVSLSPETLTAVIVDVAASLSRQGFPRQVWVAFGPGNWPSLETAAYHALTRSLAEVYLFPGFDAVWSVAEDVLEGHRPEHGRIDVHAGELERSLMLAIAPQLVDMDKAIVHYSELTVEVRSLLPRGATTNRRMMSVNLWDWVAFGKEGVSGDATLATPEKGQVLLARTAEVLANHVLRYVASPGGGER